MYTPVQLVLNGGKAELLGLVNETGLKDRYPGKYQADHQACGNSAPAEITDVVVRVEMPRFNKLSLRLVVGKSLEVLQGERKHGQGPRTALARELRDWLEALT